MSTFALIQHLQNPVLYDYPITTFQVLETHISWVILTGQFAYKIKKPVKFPFLDFSTLEKRRYYCQEELRLNKLLAPEIYVDVIAITGTEENPEWNGTGSILEYALKMREFPQEALFSELLSHGRLMPKFIDNVAHQIANFHHTATVAPNNSQFGMPEHVYAPIQQNFSQIRPLLQDTNDIARLNKLQQWATDQFQMLKPMLQERKNQGFIRECHGDIHLGNLVLYQQQPVLFDCIEFNDDFRWIDTMSDLGFFIMDLEDHARTDYSRRLLNIYLEQSGDYAGLRVLSFYAAYRAVVRAKISILRLAQPGLSAKEKQITQQTYRSYMRLAERYTTSPHPALIIMHGLSGSGKSTVGKLIVEQLGAIQIRSDVERKRLFGLAPHAMTYSNLNDSIYSPAATEQTQQRMNELAKMTLLAGYTVILDATFLKKNYRDTAYELANTLQVPFIIVHCQAPYELLQTWISQRQRQATDPSEANLEVLAMQKNLVEPLTDAEQQHTLSINTANHQVINEVLQQLETLLKKKELTS